MNILEKIVRSKKQEVQKLKGDKSMSDLEKSDTFQRMTRSLQGSIINGTGVIAEFKRASPSKGIIHDMADPQKIVNGYMEAGVSGISVLTDKPFFKACSNDFEEIRKISYLPLLRKEFMVDEWQIIESKSMGADCILLIACILTPQQIKNFQRIAGDIGLETLVEVHSPSDLDKLSGLESMIGVNNRNLDTFEVDLSASVALVSQLDNSITKIAESGIHSPEDARMLSQAGFDGWLIGELFMAEKDPGQACRAFIQHLQEITG